jgi:hypothetical protein
MSRLCFWARAASPLHSEIISHVGDFRLKAGLQHNPTVRSTQYPALRAIAIGRGRYYFFGGSFAFWSSRYASRWLKSASGMASPKLAGMGESIVSRLVSISLVGMRTSFP